MHLREILRRATNGTAESALFGSFLCVFIPIPRSRIKAHSSPKEDTFFSHADRVLRATIDATEWSRQSSPFSFPLPSRPPENRKGDTESSFRSCISALWYKHNNNNKKTKKRELLTVLFCLSLLSCSPRNRYTRGNGTDFHKLYRLQKAVSEWYEARCPSSLQTLDVSKFGIWSAQRNQP